MKPVSYTHLKNQKVRFKYFHYDREKKKWYSHNNEAYVVSPFGLLWNDGNYYLYAYDGEKFRHFRVDRMEHITVYPEPREGAEAFKRIDLNAHQAEIFNMFTGTETTVTVSYTHLDVYKRQDLHAANRHCCSVICH